MNGSNDINRLSSLLPQGGGGLIAMKKEAAPDVNDAGGSGGGKKRSLLGLDRPHNRYGNNDDNDRRIRRLPPPQQQQHQHQRAYRRHDDTPSHPGGVDRAAIVRAEERRKRDKHWRTDKNNGGRNEGGQHMQQHGRRDEDYYSGHPHDVNVTPSTHASRTPSMSRFDDRDNQRGSTSIDGRDQRWSQQQEQQQNRHQSTHPSSSSAKASSSWEIETPQPIRRNADDVEDRAMRRYSSSSSSSMQRTSGVNSNRITHGDNSYDDDPFDEMHGDLGRRLPPDQITENDDDDNEFDRRFYLAEDDEFAHGGDGGGDVVDQSRFLFESDKTRAREAEMFRRHAAAGGLVARQQGKQPRQETMRQARQSALDKDQRTWEENRLLSSGAALRSEVELDFNGDEDDRRIQLLVHQIQPPFLRDGRAKFSVIRESVPTVRDATSDFARMARDGSVSIEMHRI